MTNRHFRLGVMVESLRLGFEKGVEKIVEIGADGFQMCFTDEEPMDPARLRAMRSHVESNGLIISAVCGELGGYGNADEDAHKLKIMENVFNFASAIGTRVITGHIGEIPEDRDHPRYSLLCKSVQELGRMARERELTYAIETGPETAAVLRRFIEELDGGVGVNFDPANLVMRGYSMNGADSVAELAPYIAHTHAKDGERIGDNRRETPLGKGMVDFPLWMETLWDNGYRGFLTLERECGDDPVGDCTEAIEFLRTIDKTMKF